LSEFTFQLAIRMTPETSHLAARTWHLLTILVKIRQSTDALFLWVCRFQPG
jgi:hypothetical protein